MKEARQTREQSTLLLKNRFRDPFDFEEVISQGNRILADFRALDLSSISFIEPYSMLSLLLLGRTYLRSRGEKLRLVNIPLPIHQYLVRMDFFKFGVFEPDKELDERQLLRRSAFSNRVIEVIEIPNKERESIKVIGNVIKLFRKRASYILKHRLNDTITDYFVTVISELCQNVFEHSLDSGFIAMQTYTMGKENVVRLVIADSGVGIPGSFQKSEIAYDSNANLIEKALTTPISSKREFGYGLCQVNTIAEKLCGAVFIRSEDASVTALYNKKGKGSPSIFLKNGLGRFNGTQISISLTE